MMNVREHILVSLLLFLLSRFRFNRIRSFNARDILKANSNGCLHWIAREYFINVLLWFERVRCAVVIVDCPCSVVWFFARRVCIFAWNEVFASFSTYAPYLCNSIRSTSLFFWFGLVSCTRKRYINCNEHSVFCCQFLLCRNEPNHSL